MAHLVPPQGKDISLMSHPGIHWIPGFYFHALQFCMFEDWGELFATSQCKIVLYVHGP